MNQLNFTITNEDLHWICRKKLIFLTNRGKENPKFLVSRLCSQHPSNQLGWSGGHRGIKGGISMQKFQTTICLAVWVWDNLNVNCSNISRIWVFSLFWGQLRPKFLKPYLCLCICVSFSGNGNLMLPLMKTILWRPPYSKGQLRPLGDPLWFRQLLATNFPEKSKTR